PRTGRETTGNPTFRDQLHRFGRNGCVQYNECQVDSCIKGKNKCFLSHRTKSHDGQLTTMRFLHDHPLDAWGKHDVVNRSGSVIGYGVVQEIDTRARVLADLLPNLFDGHGAQSLPDVVLPCGIYPSGKRVRNSCPVLRAKVVRKRAIVTNNIASELDPGCGNKTLVNGIARLD